MKYFIVCGSEDPYSYDSFASYFSKPLSDEVILSHIEHWKQKFEILKTYSVLNLVVFDIDPLNGVVTVLSNEVLKRPLKSRIVLNPAAKKAPEILEGL